MIPDERYNELRRISTNFNKRTDQYFPLTILKAYETGFISNAKGDVLRCALYAKKNMSASTKTETKKR